MGHVPLLDELAIIMALAVAVTVLLARLKLPTVAGLLVAGALVGPSGLGLASSMEAIHTLAEVGVVLLLFTIGLEFSVAKLSEMFRQVALGGFLQVGLTTGAVVVIALAFDQPVGRAVLYGFIFALSSTAIVLRALDERREIEAPHGRFIVGTLIFQDLLVVPMVLIVPLLGTADSAGATGDIVGALVRASAVVGTTLFGARFIVPRVLGLADASRSREVFLLAVLSLCIGTAWLTSMAGLSLALGAFLGGVVVADTEFRHRAMGDMLPLRDAFVSIFFVSLGMLFDVRAVVHQPLLVGGLLAGFVTGKGLLATIAALVMRFPARVAWLAGVGLAQFGEFGFVLANLGQEHGLIDEVALRPLLAAGIASMVLTPLLVRLAPHVRAGERLLAPLERRIGVRGIDDITPADAAPTGQVIVIGFGLAGRLAIQTLVHCKVPCVALELNARLVREGRAAGLPVYYGDGTSEEALGHARLKQARLVVLLMNDPQAAERITATIKRVTPHVPVLMRTRYLGERAHLLAVGARDVVADEVESAVEVTARMLGWLETPRNLIDEHIRHIRNETQTSLRRRTMPRGSLSDLRGLESLKVDSLIVRHGSPSVGRSLRGLELQRVTGVLVVGLRRGDELFERPDPDLPLACDDVLYVVGSSDAIRKAAGLVDAAVSAPKATLPEDAPVG